LKNANKANQVTPVIICGGSGTRLWPLSRTAFPKQFLALSGKTTLFQQAVNRLQQLKSPSSKLNESLIVTNEDHRFLVLDQLREMKNVKAKLLLEPSAKNTAPALTFAALEATSSGQDPILVVTPADQTVLKQDAFTKSMHYAIQAAVENSIIILGVKPSRPDIGFGYILKNESKGSYEEYKVLNFTEKPDITTAKDYINSGDYFWNSGIFILRASVWLEAIKSLSPEIFEATKKAFDQKINDHDFIRPGEELFNKIPSNSIDYAVIERCLNSNINLKMIELDAGWSDLGSWNAVWEAEKKDEHQNVIYGDVLLKNTKNSLVYANDKLVTASDLNNIVIIETADAIMVADRNQSQNVKFIVDKLKNKKRQEQNLHRKVLRPWGHYETLDIGMGFKVKKIKVKPGASLSLQKHKKRAEHWVVVSGVANITSANSNTILFENQSTYIPKNTKHRLSNFEKEPLEIIEIQTGEYLEEDDIVRYKDDYGR